MTNPGGHSSVPRKENAIYQLSTALGRLATYQFPFELNGVTRAYFDALHKTTEQMWPGTPVIPEMETGASDSKATMAAGIPTYGFSGMGIDEDDDRAHVKDERLGVESYYAGVEFIYLYLEQLVGK